MKTRTHQIKLRRWFPPEDAIATAVGQLAILREDYFLELNGLIIPASNTFKQNSKDVGLGALDENSPSWRYLYFFRNSLRSLIEIRNVAERVHFEHKKELTRESLPFRNAFRKLRQELAVIPVEFEKIKKLRDNLGGHVLKNGVQDALNKMDIDKIGIFQEGEVRGKIHYKFSVELVHSVIFPGVKEENLVNEFEMLFKNTAKLVFIIGTIDEIIHSYIQGRNLLP
ncbi:hypothetical protein [Candidatus Nitrospira neomarina]|uniref:Uncharacterized protein n=1 Tax=Candidatus Nitrospira neomarina TaxID=3020899 RepID=A0AA96GG22_9BACT|nr:hypothetical protein [Candidatus Nitrospira neomarina]WNM61073.1 hypothetical protein PQG83_15095 [Candidatus Nitrospira neomarina]